MPPLRGDVEIVLQEPSEVQTNSFGEEISSAVISHRVMALRRDATGSTTTEGEVQASVQEVVWTICTLGIPTIDTAWSVMDYEGNSYSINSVREASPPMYPARKYAHLYTTLVSA